MCLGNSGSTPARMDKKWALNVRIARSAALRRWTSGGTNWYLAYHFFSDVFFVFTTRFVDLQILDNKASGEYKKPSLTNGKPNTN